VIEALLAAGADPRATVTKGYGNVVAGMDCAAIAKAHNRTEALAALKSAAEGIPAAPR
jgi:hypothetical protein